MRHKRVLIGSAVAFVAVIAVVVMLLLPHNDHGRSFITTEYKKVPVPSSLVLKSSTWVQNGPVPVGAEAGPAWVYTYTIPPDVALQGLQNDTYQALKHQGYLITGVTFTPLTGEYSFQARDVADTIKLYYLIGYNARALDGLQQPGNLVYVTAERVISQ